MVCQIHCFFSKHNCVYSTNMECIGGRPIKSEDVILLDVIIFNFADTIITMIIDLKEVFKKISEENIKLKNKEIENQYILDYIELRKAISDNNFCKMFNFRYSIADDKIDFSDSEKWNSIQMMAGEIYDNHLNDAYLEDVKKYIYRVCESLDPVSDEIEEYLSKHIGEKNKIYCNLLLIVEDSMIKIAEFREKYVEEINDGKYVFSSYLDFLTTGDYLRLSLIEDFVLDQGAFGKNDDMLSDI